MRTRKMALLMAVALLVAASGGNGGGPDPTVAPTTTPAPAGEEVTIRTSEFMFTPSEINVPAGVPVTIIVINDGVVEHDFTVDDLNLEILVHPGETKSETITIPAGEYEIHCTIPGHHEAGMMGTLKAG